MIEMHNIYPCVPFCDDDVPAVLNYGYPVGVEELAVALADLAKLELEPTLLVEYLDPENSSPPLINT